MRLALEAKKPKQRELRDISWTRLILGPRRAADERASPSHAPTPQRIWVGQEILDQDFEERSHRPMMAVIPDGNRSSSCSDGPHRMQWPARPCMPDESRGRRSTTAGVERLFQGGRSNRGSQDSPP